MMRLNRERACALLLGASALPAAAAEPADSRGPPRTLGENMFGGRLVTAPQIILSSGYPHAVRADIRLPVGVVELAPAVYFDWSDHHGRNFDYGTGVDLHLRIHVFRKDAWDVALRFGSQFDVRLDKALLFGVHLGDPGVRVSVNVARIVDIDFGLEVIPQLQFGPRHDHVDVDVAVPLMVGAEGNVAKGIQVGFTVRGGPSFDSHGDHGPRFDPTKGPGAWNVSPWLEALFHVGFSLGGGKQR